MKPRRCKRGHPWNASNTYWYIKDGLPVYRACRRCHSDRRRAKYVPPVCRKRKPYRHKYSAGHYPL